MKTLVTVSVAGDAVRISKVTAHGEEVLEVDVEAKALAMLLWARLKLGDPGTTDPLFPSLDRIEKSFEKLAASLDRAAVSADKHVAALEQERLKAAQSPARPGPTAQ